MRLVDGNQHNSVSLVEILHDVKKLGHLKTLRGHEERVAGSLRVPQPSHHRTILRGGLGTRKVAAGNTSVSEFSHYASTERDARTLILHQRNQRRNHDAHSVSHERRNLVAQ